MLVKSVSIAEGKENSLQIRFSIVRNETLNKLQSYLFEKVPVSYYHPDNFQFHITIHCDKDHSKIYKMQELLSKKFTPFELEVKRFGLFEIYPANKILEMETTK